MRTPIHLMAWLALSLISPTALCAAQPLAFAQFPMESAHSEPAPNLIVSVDNSASMATPDVQFGDAPTPITRLDATKAILRAAFDPSVIPDNAARIAYQAAHGCATLTPAGCRHHQHTNQMAWLQGHADASEASTRGALLRFVDELSAGNGVSYIDLVFTAGTYLRQTGRDNPWNSMPGIAQAAPGPLPCRQAYHLLFTDGESAPLQPLPTAPPPTRLPDGTDVTHADPTHLAAYQRPPRDGPVSAASLAWHFWASDLQPDLPNLVPPRYPQPQSERSPSGHLTVSPYWNPRNDPATWQHMVHFTVDMGPLAAAQHTAPDDALAGTWFTDSQPPRSDLWLAALHSRGQTFHAHNATPQLVDALRAIIANVQGPDAWVTSSVATSGIATDTATNPATTFIARYRPRTWTGRIEIRTTGRAQRSTADRLDALTSADQRLILSHNGERGVPFRWQRDGSNGLSPAQQQQLQTGSPVENFGAHLVDYIRGDRRREGTPFRVRTSRQGDIVHSRIWHAGKPAAGHATASYRAFAAAHAGREALLYVGGNDGMLHAFSASTGEEVFAYVPAGLLHQLHWLARPDYAHRYYVDGSPFVGDANLGSTAQPDWRSLLVSALGAGGPGYVVLDVTSITDRSTEAMAADMVLMDRTDGSDPDIGHIFAQPTLDEARANQPLHITRTNNGRWALILGNGYNSAHGMPVLLIQYLDGDRGLRKIVADAPACAFANGLSAPQFLDVNGDATPDVVYAGDLQGHLWKFDISSASDADWHVAHGGAPLFTAQRNGQPQAITSAPVVRVHPEINGLMVAFGTGRDLTASDRTDASVQTFYGVMDYARYAVQGAVIAEDASRRNTPVPATSRAELAEHRVNPTELRGAASSEGRSYWELQHIPFTYCTAAPCAANEKKGWFIDLPLPRERVISAPRFFGGGNILEIASVAPATAVATETPMAESCDSTLSSDMHLRSLMHIATGSAPRTRTLDTNGDGLINGDDAPAFRSTTSPHSILTRSRGRTMRQGPDGRTELVNEIPSVLLRPSWRQLK